MMYSTKRFASHSATLGEPLPAPWTVFHVNNINFRRRTTGMIAGTPGSFKSVLALNLAVLWANQDMRVMYFSADMDGDTVVERLNGIITGTATVNVALKPPKKQREEIAAGLKRSIYFDYESRDYHDIERRLKSYEAIYGLYPDVVFLDNMIDFVDNPDAWSDMLTMTRDLDITARETESHIVIIHHARLRDENAPKQNKKPEDQPPSEGEIMGRITQKPRLVLTVASSGMTQYLACVKQSRGPSDRTASQSLIFNIDHSMRMSPRNETARVYS